MFRKRLIYGMLAVALLFGGTAYARGWGWGHDDEGWHHRGPVAHLIHRLDLTDVQRQKLADVLRKHESALAQKMDGLSAARQGVFALMGTDKVDAAAQNAALAKLDTAQRDMATLWFQVQGELVSVLTPQQRDTLRQSHDRWLAHMKERSQEHSHERLSHWIDELSR